MDDMKVAFCYLARVGTQPGVRIGCALNLKKELARIQSLHTNRVHYELLAPGGLGLRNSIHRRFAKYRIYGNWFRFREDMISAFGPEVTSWHPMEDDN